MLRIKIDPRTVMTIQNQIPRVIICIILITFSYAFAGAMIDVMWAVTYMGVNKITQTVNPQLAGCNGIDGQSLKIGRMEFILEKINDCRWQMIKLLTAEHFNGPAQ